MTPPLPSDDADLVVLARRGRHDAFAVLYERYFNAVFDFLTRLLRDRHEAADVTQDTFVKAFERLGHLKNPSAFKSWIFTIAHRNALNRIKRSKRAVAVGSFAEVDADERATFAVIDVDQGGNPEHQVEIREAAEIVWEAAAGLDERTYAVMDLHVRHGLDSAEIAEVLGVSRGNAYTMVSRMKKSVSDTMATYLLVRKGRAQCEGLAALVEDLGGPELTPELRRSVDRHTKSCEVCAEQRRTLFVPLRLFAALVMIPAPAALKGSIWATISGAAAGGAAAAAATGAGQGGGATAAAGSTGGAAAGTAAAGAAAAGAAAVGAGAAVKSTAGLVAAVLVLLAAALGGIAVVVNPSDGEPGQAAASSPASQPGQDGGDEDGVPAPEAPAPPAPPDTTTTSAPPTTRPPATPDDPRRDPEAPVLVAVDDAATLAEDTIITVDVLQNDVGADRSSLTLVTGPGHGAAAVVAGSIRYSPERDFFGRDALVYRVDGAAGGTAQARLTLAVTGVNDPPRGQTDRAFTIGEDGVIRFDPLAGYTDPDGDRLAVGRFDAETPNGGQLTEGSLIYRPAADWSGSDRFSYTVSDGASSLTVSVRVVVKPINDPPRGPDRTVQLDEDTSRRIDLLRGWTDVEGSTPRLVDVGKITARHGRVVVIGGSALYTPEPNFFGRDSFEFTVSDGAAQATGRVDVEVTAVADPPRVDDLTLAIEEGTPIGTTVGRLNATDPDREPLEFVVTGGNTQTLTVTRQGAVEVIGAVDRESAPALQLRGYVEDPTGLRDWFLVRAVVTGLNEPPSVDDARFMVEVGAPPNTVVGRLNAVDPEGDELRFEIVGVEANRVLKVDPSTGEVRVARRALARFFPVTVTVRVTDRAGLWDEAELTVVAVDTRGPELSTPLVDRLTVYEAAADGGRCSLGPNRTNLGVRVSDPSGVRSVTMEWSASLGDEAVSGTTSMTINGDKATGFFTFPAGSVDADGSSRLVVVIVARDELGNTASTEPVTIAILACPDGPPIGDVRS